MFKGCEYLLTAPKAVLRVRDVRTSTVVFASSRMQTSYTMSCMRVMVFLGQDGVGEKMLFRLPKTRNADALAQVDFPHNVRALNT
tara:strand:- start:2463 stop:2717 length:255 start_codon:yes stop_codon:yes gene_type:complete